MNRDHTSVLSGCRNIDDQILSDATTREQLAEIELALGLTPVMTVEQAAHAARAIARTKRIRREKAFPENVRKANNGGRAPG